MSQANADLVRFYRPLQRFGFRFYVNSYYNLEFVEAIKSNDFLCFMVVIKLSIISSTLFFLIIERQKKSSCLDSVSDLQDCQKFNSIFMLANVC